MVPLEVDKQQHQLFLSLFYDVNYGERDEQKKNNHNDNNNRGVLQNWIQILHQVEQQTPRRGRVKFAASFSQFIVARKGAWTNINSERV